MLTKNIFADAQPPEQGERFEELLRHCNLVIERIVSSAQITPTEYVQAQDEWVVLMQGEAVLRMQGTVLHLKSGDYVFIAAGVKHIVESASHGAIWLAVHLYPKPLAENLP
ncbi:MAG: cupin domain-containing protein [Methylococcaceae bacterium]|jgi:cupin 2 domain-containing protein